MKPAPKKKGRKPNPVKRQKTNLLVYRDIRDRLIAVHKKSGEKYIYQTLEKAIGLLEDKLC